jgi:glycine/sarcosine N-methyltransferase
MYETFSKDYDRFVNWQNRLAYELPFIQDQLQSVNAKRVLDAATGTGMHAIALAKRGYQVNGVDLSPAMIEQAQNNARAAGIQVDFQVAGFGELSELFKAPIKDRKIQAMVDTFDPFDTILCLGNSLPHLLSITQLEKTLLDFSSILRPGGLLLVQNRNFDMVLTSRQRWMEPQAHIEGLNEWIFLRFYDFRPDGLIDFHILTLTHMNQSSWQQQISTIQLYPFTRADLIQSLPAAGFEAIQLFGGLDGSVYRADESGNLVISAQRSSRD